MIALGDVHVLDTGPQGPDVFIIIIIMAYNGFLMPTSSTERLQTAFTNVLGVNPDSNFDSLAYGQTEGWDSVAHMALISEIESAFDVMMDTDDVIGLSSFPKAKELLAKYGVSFS